MTSSGSGAHDNIFVGRYYASSGNAEWVRNNTTNVATGQSNPLAIGVSGTLVHVLGFVLNKTINVSFCGTAKNMTGNARGNSYLATYTQRLFAPSVSGPMSTLPGETEEYFVNPMPGVKAHDWYVPPGWTINYYGNPPGYFAPLKTYMFTSIGSVSGNVVARAVYDCGNTTLTNLFINVGSGGHFTAFYPNPAASTLAVDLKGFDEAVVISLLDDSGYATRQILYDPESGQDPSVKMEVQSLKSGLYFLQLTSSKRVYRERLSISH